MDWGDSRATYDEQRVALIRADGSSQMVLWRVTTGDDADYHSTAILKLPIGEHFIVTCLTGAPVSSARWRPARPPDGGSLAGGLRLDILGARALATIDRLATALSDSGILSPQPARFLPSTPAVGKNWAASGG